jgi:alpha-beta hydrolase superfamily lysophospholipase
MWARFAKIVKLGAALLAASAIVLFAARAFHSQRGRPLEPWHTYVPHELSVSDLDRDGWSDYLIAENAIFDRVRAKITARLEPRQRVAINRYFDGSPIYPGHFAQDWNRSFIIEPRGPPVGAAVFLHGLTDSPYSLREIARRYSEHGYVAVVIRLPGHGTVPGGLTGITWEEWLAAARLAVREARRRVGPSAPLHLVGYSNGGALAMMYALDALDDKALTKPDRVVLISPMIGVTAFARFAGLAAVPAIFPAFARAAWLSVLPEFNPFKYNSFPVNGARQSHLLTSALRQNIERHAQGGRLIGLPPIITFQSLVDFTVSTRAIISALYLRLPSNGSELVLFDFNRNAKLGPILSSSADTIMTGLLPDPPRAFRATIITNASPDTNEVVERVTESGAQTDQTRPLAMSYPADVFSLSHIALPFPISDPLYGLQPDPNENFGIRLGVLAPRGERGALIVNLDSLLRLSSNPFFPYLMRRIEEGIN